MRRVVCCFPVLALALLLAAPAAHADPFPPWCPDPGPDDEGFYTCPCPACMAPCRFPDEPQGECKGPDGTFAESTFTCCCCGGSLGYSFRFFTPFVDLQPLADATLLTWTDIPSAEAFDVVSGDLDALRNSGGDFGEATAGCLDDDNVGVSLMVDATPPPGKGIWFLVRGEAVGSYDSHGGAQLISRDALIAVSGNDCS